ncbi:putative [histone H3]-lysine(4) N-trimethyltransferase chromatin remodeling SET family [Helianthus annuus]|nr:putative [histone H3]-lysine(4) N-trimethyltransferase chromatin remodeling SET family [Helianthus annuus]
MEPKLEPLESGFSLNPNPSYRPSVPVAQSNSVNAVHRLDDDKFDGSEMNLNANNANNFEEDEHVNVDLDFDEDVMDPYALAIVPVTEDNQLAHVESVYRRKPPPRSAELVRVTNLEIEDERYFRELVRRTRILYDSLWIHCMLEDDIRRRNVMNVMSGRVPRARGDMKVAALMRDRGLWLNQDKRFVGPIPGIHVGDVFCFRMELCVMERSMHHGVEVRVVRGFKYKGGIGEKVYVYDGIYKIEEYWFDVGKSGFGVYKFKLVRMEGQPEMGSSILKFAESIRANPLAARPVGYVSLDMSRNKEQVPVFLFNDIDDNHEPLNFDYQVTTIFPPFVYHNVRSTGGCNCVDGCTLDCVCVKKNGGECAYDLNGRILRGKPIIFECGPFCSCPSNCLNRVSQKGVKNRFEVFRSMETGWGVRSLDLIQAGSFICEYTGVVLTRDQAQVFTMNGEDSLVYPNRFGERWAEWGDFSQVYSDYVRPSYPSIPPLEFAIDVSKMRNVACYMSHSPCPNVFVQLVMYDHAHTAYPHLMLFAMENIPPMRELSLDYGAADEWTEKLAICN